MTLLALLASFLMAIVTFTREMPGANFVALCLVCGLLWAFPLIIQLLAKQYAYAIAVSWIVLLGSVIFLQTTAYLFGPERHLILSKGWPPLVMLGIPLYQIIAKTFLVPRHAVRVQVVFLAGLGLVASAHAAIFWQQAETVRGMSVLLLAIVLLGPLIMVLMHLQDKVQNAIKIYFAVQSAKSELSEILGRHGEEKEEKILEIRRFISALSDPVRQLPFAQISAHIEMYGEFSGDFFMLKEGEQGELNFALCDAMGHGASAGMLSIVAKSALEGGGFSGTPRDWADCVHRALTSGGELGYITGVFGRLYSSGKLEIIHLGHPPSLIVNAQQSEPQNVSGSGMAMGMFEGDLLGELETIQLNEGETLVLWTDGFIEVKCDGIGEEYGMARFVESCQPAAAITANNVLHSAFDGIYDFVGAKQFEDDISMVCIQYQRPTNV
ncbi:MAG: PP2C family protein-serine/threonine phosphatase [Oceanococcus sp.]